MTSNLKFATLALGATMTAMVAGHSKAQSFTAVTPIGTYTSSLTRPSTTYEYVSPQLSVFAGVLTGNNQNTAVHQNSTLNISSFAQVGNHSNATVVQYGAQDFSNIAQVGHYNSALVLQFGSH